MSSRDLATSLPPLQGHRRGQSRRREAEGFAEGVRALSAPGAGRDISESLRIELVQHGVPTVIDLTPGASGSVLSAAQLEILRTLLSVSDRGQWTRTGEITSESAEDIVERMLAVIPSGDWNDRTGPYYDVAQIMAWRGVSKQRVSVYAKDGRILGLPTRTGKFVFPTFQFDEYGEFLPRLREIQGLLRPVMDPWTIALWLQSSLPEWNGNTAAQMLQSRTPTDAEAVVEQARRDAGRRAS